MTGLLDQGITIIGSGRVATSLAHTFRDAGVLINEIYSRRLAHAQMLVSNMPETKATDSLDFSSSRSSIYIIAVNDDVIVEVAHKISLPENSCVFHTSGTVSLQALAGTKFHYGIFYPLQTFTTDSKIELKEVPVLIEGNGPEALLALKELGAVISNQVNEVSEADRQQLHIAAVFASNFTNRMLAAAQELLKDTRIDLTQLRPLVEQSIENAFNQNPDQSLTGPAKRGDLKTIDRHLQILKEKPLLLAIYQQMTNAITSKFSTQN